jgi:general secretion pathway protein G
MRSIAWLGLGILVLLVGIGAYWADSGKITRPDEDYWSIGSSLERYHHLAGCYPSTDQGLVALVEKPSIDPLPRRWARTMEALPADEWGHRYQYLLFSSADPRIYEIRSLGPDGVVSEDDAVRYGKDLKENMAKELEDRRPPQN